jgi:uncharacterized protein (TIGR02145 family)
MLIVLGVGSIMISCKKQKDDNPLNGRSTAVFKSGIDYGSLTDQDGNTYKTVKIGTQTWMAENLRTTKYRNGELITNVESEDFWAYRTTGAYCNYKNTLDIDTISTYGRLYNWYAVTDTRDLAPDGWHVSTDADWTILTSFLGDSIAAGKLKEEGFKHWRNPNLGATNETGFTALPGGVRFLQSSITSFRTMGLYGEFWSVDQISTLNPFSRNIAAGFTDVLRNTTSKSEGHSVRCVKN